MCQEVFAGSMPRARDDPRGLEHRVGLAPVVGPLPKVLILGTIPSVMSDRRGQYYGNP